MMYQPDFPKRIRIYCRRGPSSGRGDIDEGAAVMENLMENLEAGGKVSEESQGLEGAQAMFANTQRLQNRII